MGIPTKQATRVETSLIRGNWDYNALTSVKIWSKCFHISINIIKMATKMFLLAGSVHFYQILSPINSITVLLESYMVPGLKFPELQAFTLLG